MTTVGLSAWGAYAPRLRLQRKSVTTANAWIAPNLGGWGPDHLCRFLHHLVDRRLHHLRQVLARLDQRPRRAAQHAQPLRRRVRALRPRS